MSKKQIGKLLLLNTAIIAVNVILFSRGLVGLTFSDGILRTALGVTDIVMSAVAFFWGNGSILLSSRTPKLYAGNELNNEKDYVSALEERRDKKVFLKDINAMTELIGRLRARNESLDSILSQRFMPQEMTAVRFRSVIDSVNAAFYDNVKQMLNRITLFDEKDYTVLLYRLQYSKNTLSQEESQNTYERLTIYKEHLDHVKQLIEMNEGMIVKLDRLLLELSKLDDLHEGNIENMAAIQEINDLIEQTKYYQH